MSPLQQIFQQSYFGISRLLVSLCIYMKVGNLCWTSRPLQGAGTQSFWVKRRVTRLLSLPHPSHCNAPSHSWSNVAYSFLPPTSPLLTPPLQGLIHPQPPPYRALCTPTDQRVYHKTLFPQPISRAAGVPWALSSPCVMKRDMCLVVALADPQEAIRLCQQHVSSYTLLSLLG